MQDNQNFLLAAALCFLVLLAWQWFVIDPQTAAPPDAPGEASQGTRPSPGSSPAPSPGPSSVPRPPASPLAPPNTSRESSLPQPPASPFPLSDAPTRLEIRSDQLVGSLNLRGARLDDLRLLNYPTTLEADAPPVQLLMPQGAGDFWHAQFGWVGAAGQELALPDETSLWQVVSQGALTPQNAARLRWQNGSGLVVTRTIALDEDFLFTITDEVDNQGDAPVTLYPFAQLARRGEPQTPALFVLHEGAIGVFGEDTGLVEHSYSDLRDEPLEQYRGQGGWLGFTDKYWASIIIPPQDAAWQGRFTSAPSEEQSLYRADYLLPGRTLAAGERWRTQSRFFAGAKRVQLMDRYRQEGGVYRFDLLIDWGWFSFLTKPLFLLLAWLYQLLGNYGAAILAVTVLIRLVFFPLANHSFAAMAQMKKLQPHLVALRERYPDDKQRQQQEMVKLYRDSKVNPLAGCLPLLAQIPVFFALYKVLYVTLDMRHQPFFGWVQDLSAPDPTSLFNLFGLLPFQPPGFLMIGVWPLLMGLTMFLQMQMNPPPPDPVQARLFQLMPLVFTFILAGFPAGLVIYWAWNNLLSIAQQAVIMRRYKVEINLLQNLGWRRAGGKKPAAPPPPSSPPPSSG